MKRPARPGVTGEFEALLLAPREKPTDRPSVGGLRVGDSSGEKFIGGEASRRPRPLEDGGKLG